MRRWTIGSLALVALAVCPFVLSQDAGRAGRLKYPETRKVEQVDNYHGTKVADPYRWLEDDNSSDTAAWVAAENEVTFGYLAGIPQRDTIKARLTKLWNYERFGLPSHEGQRYVYSRNEGLQNQSVIWVTDNLDGEPRVLINPNELSKDGTVALGGMAFTDDGDKLAYTVSTSGSDWVEIHLRDVATSKDAPDVIKWVKFSGADWTKDGQGFFYSRYDEPKTDTALSGVNKYQKLYYHRVGQPQEKDLLVYERPDQPDWGFGAGVTEDGQYLVLSISEGTERKNRLFVRDLKAIGIDYKPTEFDQTLRGMEREAGAPYYKSMMDKDATPEQKKAAREASLKALADRAAKVKSHGGMAHGFHELLTDFDAQYGVIENDGTTLYMFTDKDAPRGRVVAIDMARPEPANWREIIPQQAETLLGVNMLNNDMLVASYLKDAASLIKIYAISGKPIREVKLPGLGTAGGFGGKRKDKDTFYSYTSFNAPPTIYHYDMVTGESKLFRQPKVDFNPDDYEVKQVFFNSKDGTRIPMFITHKKGLKLDGTNPTYLYGYGGFNISMRPSFSISNLVWMEMGGVYAMANLRGGGEYGKAWHDAGRLANKQNVFDDFIGAAEWLIANKYTTNKKLAIGGGSNGGLLVGACMTQRPDLYGACLPDVGVMDMLRFHKFTIGWGWTADYGCSDIAEQFAWLIKYSPLQNIKPGTNYPATMISTADHDDRVVPAHSFKFAAALQAAQKGDAPTLIRVQTKAGHGAGKPTTKIIEEVADKWAFLVKNLGMEPKLN